MKSVSDVLTIYKYINSLGNKIVTPTVIDHGNLGTVLNNINKVLPSSLSLSNSLPTVPESPPY